MSIRILLDHGVRQDHIIFVTFLVARTGGITTLHRAFPHVKIVCGAVDNEMREGWLEGDRGEGNEDGIGRKIWVMNPGMGQIGNGFRQSTRSLLLIDDIAQGIGIICDFVVQSGLLM